MLNALIADGSIRAAYESISPSSFTTRKVGIIPPWNSMVNTTRKLNTLRPSRSLLERP
ncbi:hypothetical protein D3C84_1148460 [compost metagenome]